MKALKLAQGLKVGKGPEIRGKYSCHHGTLFRLGTDFVDPRYQKLGWNRSIGL